MKPYFLFVSFLFAGVISSTAAEPISNRLKYLEGSYALVGRHPDSKQAYSGRATIAISDQGLKITRVINGRTIVANGNMDTATPDQIPVLRVSFKKDGKHYEETCMVSSDLDNYSRVTCYLYQETTKKVGLEAWFPDHGQLVHE